jgi:effector-binding domain-containing protein
MLDAVWAFLRAAPAEVQKHGHNVMLYEDDIPNVEVGVVVTGSFDPSGDVVPSHLPGGLAVTAVHTGPVQLIGDTHQAIVEWCRVNSHPTDGRRWEIYGDPDTSTGNFSVEVYWSVQPA